MVRIVRAEARSRYRLYLVFDDGVAGEVDLSDLVGQGVFASWRDPAQFARVGIDAEAGTVCWPGGIDLCPDTLHRDILAMRPGAVADSSS
ncbi:MAG: DUF2442 domain-containing protein [Planctomycetes bacterium]|nr:DUF2442 domain-containing protein [Planctomycetota bacterium]